MSPSLSFDFDFDFDRIIKDIHVFQDLLVALNSMEAAVTFVFQIRTDTDVFAQREYS